MTLNILIIDDERIFPSLEAAGILTYARTSTAGIQLLRDGVWDEVWFDHDLGQDDDAMKIVKWMECYPEDWSIKRAYIHSMNPVGAANLRSRIKDFGIPTYRVGLPDGHTVIG